MIIDLTTFIFHLKKVITIFFLSVYLFSTTEMIELLKLPIVFEHFSEHQKDNQSISILQFLAIHYLHGSPKDQDYERDMQLPFKTTGENCFYIVSTYISPVEPICLPNPIKMVKKQTKVFPHQYFNSSYLANIWQPPKFC